MRLAAALIYWAIVALWLAVLATVVYHYVRNPKLFCTTRMLLAVVAIDTCRNIVENVYFGLFFGSQYGLFPGEIGQVLGNPGLLIVPKLLNIAAGGVVLGLLLNHWLPRAIKERFRSEQARADLATLATEDPLTGVANRRQFDAVGRSEWARFQRYGRPLSLLVLDLDGFKTVNDHFGHVAGDLILKNIANACDFTRREPDLVARIDGDEFALLLPETDEASAEALADRLRNNIATTPHKFGDQRVQVTVSIGVAGGTLSMPSFDTLLKRADDALCVAKTGGRNRVVRAPRERNTAYQLAAE
jgi:diguanylate cyclase (GGDEF)-like protein